MRFGHGGERCEAAEVFPNRIGFFIAAQNLRSVKPMISNCDDFGPWNEYPLTQEMSFKSGIREPESDERYVSEAVSS